MTITFCVTTLVVVATPGTGALYTIAAGMARGRRASFIAAVGCTLGVVPHMIAAISGLAALLNASALAFETIKLLGVAYLVYLAWHVFRDRTALDVDGTAAPGSAWSVIRTAILINVLNPKLTIFFFAFLPQFVRSGEQDAWLQMTGLSLVFMATTLLVFAIYGQFAGGLRTYVVGRPRVVAWMRRSFAATYVVLAGRLALQDR